eukprot:COSAG01_NODE_7608_length_3129_cov_1.233333_4_plen_96_part_00
MNGGVSGSNGGGGAGAARGRVCRLFEDHIILSWPGSAPLQCGSALIQSLLPAGPLSRLSKTPLDTGNGFYGVLRPCTLAETAVVWGVEDVETFSD